MLLAHLYSLFFLISYQAEPLKKAQKMKMLNKVKTNHSNSHSIVGKKKPKSSKKSSNIKEAVYAEFKNVSTMEDFLEK